MDSLFYTLTDINDDELDEFAISTALACAAMEGIAHNSRDRTLDLLALGDFFRWQECGLMYEDPKLPAPELERVRASMKLAPPTYEAQRSTFWYEINRLIEIRKSAA